MKSKNILFILFLLLGTISCINEIENSPRNEDHQPENKIISIDKELIYRKQTDKDVILNSMIRYDYSENKYLLDLSEGDAEKLGIIGESYLNGKKRVEQMNRVDIEHQ